MKIFCAKAGEINENSIMELAKIVYSGKTTLCVRLRVYDNDSENILRTLWHTIIILYEVGKRGCIVWIDENKYEVDSIQYDHRDNSYDNFFLSGRVSEILIYDRLLNDWECKWLVRGGLVADGLRAWLRFDNINNNVLSDVTGNGHDGTVENIPLADGMSVEGTTRVLLVRGAKA